MSETYEFYEVLGSEDYEKEYSVFTNGEPIGTVGKVYEFDGDYDPIETESLGDDKVENWEYQFNICNSLYCADGYMSKECAAKALINTARQEIGRLHSKIAV